jgi:hypothetical protein
MSKNNSLNISFEDLFKLIVGFITDDLKVQKHYHNLSLSGLDTSPLELNLHNGIFILVGFKENNITDEIKQWYFKQTERIYNIDIINDEKALRNLSSEILEGLLKVRNKVYSQKNGNGS